MLAAEPTLQGAFAGHRVGRAGVGQTYANVAGSPGGMLLPQGQGQRVEGMVLVGGMTGPGPVGGLERLPLLLEALQQLAYRPWAEVKGLRDGGGGLATAGAAKDEAAHGQGKWGRHGDPRKSGWGLTISLFPCLGAAKPFCRD